MVVANMTVEATIDVMTVVLVLVKEVLTGGKW